MNYIEDLKLCMSFFSPSDVFKRELRVLALLGIEKLLLLLLRGRILSPGSTNFGVLRLVKFSY